MSNFFQSMTQPPAPGARPNLPDNFIDGGLSNIPHNNTTAFGGLNSSMYQPPFSQGAGLQSSTNSYQQPFGVSGNNTALQGSQGPFPGMQT